MTERDERIVSAGLRAFADQTRDREAPPELENLLRGQFARHQRTSRGLKNKWLAIAAMVAIAVLTGWLWRTQRAAPAPHQRLVAALPEPTPVPAVEPTFTKVETAEPSSQAEAAKPTVRRAWSSPQPNMLRESDRNQRQEAAGLEALTPWYVNSALPPISRGRVLRVEVSQETAASFGVYAPRGAARADLLVGDDGLAHAIRFVR